jgi:hypothetical protein
MPPVSGWLLAEFQNPRRLPMWLRWGGQPNNGGGLYVVGGVLCLISALMLWTTPRSDPPGDIERIDKTQVAEPTTHGVARSRTTPPTLPTEMDAPA